MANEEHVALLKQGVVVWNKWRQKTPDIKVDLTEAYLSGADLGEVYLSRANLIEANLSGTKLNRAKLDGADLGAADLSGANLSGADLSEAYLNEADLSGANLSGADLSGVNLSGADLREADMTRTNLIEANLSRADLSRADLGEADLSETVFGDTNLSDVKGLDRCRHSGPSTIDHRTLQRSGPLPLTFLRGVGLPDNLIHYLPSLLNRPIQFLSCFISYSSQDRDFAERLHADLQNKGVRCWFAPHDMKTGDRIRDLIDAQIRVRGKLLIVLSSASIDSDWVEDEVEAALEEERKSENRRTVLFPIQIDDAVNNPARAWAGKIRRTRHITNFSGWKDYDAYQKILDRLLRDLKVAQTEP
jgi:uncharacterized protein YjbI with pentapeptide repeats